MGKIFLIVLVAVFFLGCSQKEEVVNLLKKDRVYTEALRNTQKGDILLSLENKAQIIATYLNEFNDSYEDETFFVRVYIDNDFDDENRSGLFHPGYTLALNSQKPLEIKILDKENLLVKTLPFTQPWYHYYLVKFKRVEEDMLNLRFANENYGETILTFEKSGLD